MSIDLDAIRARVSYAPGLSRVHECDCTLCDCWRLIDEVERLRAELERVALLSIEQRNPGIDMDEVRRTRADRG